MEKGKTVFASLYPNVDAKLREQDVIVDEPVDYSCSVGPLYQSPGPNRWINYATGTAIEASEPPYAHSLDGQYPDYWIAYVDTSRVKDDGTFKPYMRGSATWVACANSILAYEASKRITQS